MRVAVKERDGFSRWYFPVRVDRLKAVGAGSAWLEQHPGIAKRARNAHFVEAQLVWAPIWEYKALVVGWEFGSRLRTQNELVGEEDNERLELQLVRERVEEPHLQERRFFQAATDLAALGATRPRITGREPALPLLAGELDASALVLEAEGTAAEMIEKGRRAVLQPLSGALSPDVHLFALRESTTLLFYPLWLLRYRDGNRSYRMVVNGRDGTVNSATAPADITEQVVRLIVTGGLDGGRGRALGVARYRAGSGPCSNAGSGRDSVCSGTTDGVAVPRAEGGGIPRAFLQLTLFRCSAASAVSPCRAVTKPPCSSVRHAGWRTSRARAAWRPSLP